MKIWFQNRRAKERRALKKHDDVMSKDKLDAVAATHAAAAHAQQSAAMSAAFGESVFGHAAHLFPGAHAPSAAGPQVGVSSAHMFPSPVTAAPSYGAAVKFESGM